MNFFKDKTYLYFYENEQEFRILYKEIFKNEIYKPPVEVKDQKQQRHKDTKLIIDIGAHIGLTTLYFRKQFPDARILSYEPNPSTFSILSENMNINGIKNVDLKNVAITNKSGSTKLYVDNKNNWNSTASLLPKGWNDTQKLSEIDIKTDSFSEIIDQNPVIIKMDIEGIEQALIKNNIEALKKNTSIKLIFIEFHQNKTQNLHRLIKLLTTANFEVTTKSDTEDENLIMLYCCRS